MQLCMCNMNLHFVFAQFYNAENICTTNALYFVQINEETGNRRPIMLAFPSPEEMSENGNKEESKEPSVETVHSGMDREKDLIAIYVQSRHIKAFVQIHIVFFFFFKKKILLIQDNVNAVYILLFQSVKWKQKVHRRQIAE